MSERYSLRRQVHQDLDDIAEYLVLNSRGGADSARRVLHAIENTFNRIADQPKASPVIEPVPGGEPFPFELRKRVVTQYTDYLVFYTTTADAPEMVRVLHGAQDWLSLLFRDDE